MPTTTRSTPRPAAPYERGLMTALHATAVEEAEVHLRSTRRDVPVPVYVRSETIWTDPLPRGFGAVPNKPAYVLDGVPLYPELVVVRLLEQAGWSATWRKTWGGDAYWRDIGEVTKPSRLALTIVEQVSAQAGYAGPWDVVAWRGRTLRLLSSHPAGGQRVSAFLAGWLDAALRMGIPLGCFAIVEHQPNARRVARRR
jgi:hypothetical protein